MSPFTCARERELSELLRQGYWPKACSDDLRAHVASCRSCSDLVLVTGTLQAARKETAELPRLEPAGAIWWRAQLRRRNAAIEKMARPILGAQLFAFAVTLVLLAAVLVWQAGNIGVWIQNLPNALNLGALVPASLADSSTPLWIVIPIVASVALISGVVVYLVSEKQ